MNNPPHDRYGTPTSGRTQRERPRGGTRQLSGQRVKVRFRLRPVASPRGERDPDESGSSFHFDMLCRSEEEPGVGDEWAFRPKTFGGQAQLPR